MHIGFSANLKTSALHSRHRSTNHRLDHRNAQRLCIRYASGAAHGHFHWATTNKPAPCVFCSFVNFNDSVCFPFVDGNGRGSRLMSYAMALEAGIGAHGLW
jgi:hypothetical protein